MNHSLLAIESLWLAAGFAFGSFLFVILVEAVIMTLFKLNSFGRNLRDSLMANIGSALFCLLIFLIINKIEIEDLSHLMIFTVFFLVSSFFEGWLIKLLNRPMSWSKILASSLVMNLVTYAGSFLVLTSAKVLG